MSGERVVLIGAGATGALSAVRLAERGFRVTVLEKAAIGNGSSSRSNACIRAQFGVAETITGMMYSEWAYRRFHEWLQTPPQSRQPVMEQNGYLFLYEHPDTVAPQRRAETGQAWQQALARVELQQRLGLEVEVLSPAQVSARWPHLDPERLIGATWCPTDGFLHPHVIYGEGFRRARELGVEVFSRTEVVGARRAGDRIIAVETTRGPLEGEYFVNATNAWAPRTSERLGGMPLPIAPLKRYLYHLKVTRPIMDEDAWRRLPMTIYGMGPGRGTFSRPDGPQLILGLSHKTDSEPDFADEDQDRIMPGFSHEHGLENLGYQVLEQVAEFAPELADAGGLAATNCGYYGMTPDANPLIGFDALVPNLLHAAGFSGHGIMHAPVTAVLIEALLAGDVQGGHVRLPHPFEQHRIALAAFDPAREFRADAAETMVL
ncbi:MAG TPA: FAD-binding oxidoreductase [Ktedonobacterales bacterium]